HEAWLGESYAGPSLDAMDQGIAAEPGADLDVSRGPVGWYRRSFGWQAGGLGHPSFEPGARSEQAPHDLDRTDLRSTVALGAEAHRLLLRSVARHAHGVRLRRRENGSDSERLRPSGFSTELGSALVAAQGTGPGSRSSADRHGRQVPRAEGPAQFHTGGGP